jgi:hypothetical protein
MASLRTYLLLAGLSTGVIIPSFGQSDSPPPWSDWQPIYTVEGNTIQFSYRSRGCSGSAISGWPRYRTLNARSMPQCWLKGKFDYRDCEGNVQTESFAVELAKAGIDDDAGRWFLGKEVLRFHSLRFDDYRTNRPDPVESPEARQAREAAERARQEEAIRLREELDRRQRQTEDLHLRAAGQQQAATESAANQASLTESVTDAMLADGPEAVGYAFSRWALLGGVGVSLQQVPVYARQTGGGTVAEAVLGYGATGHLEGYFVRGRYGGLGALGEASYQFSTTSTGRDERLFTYCVGGRVLAGLRGIKLVGEYHYGQRSVSLYSQDDLLGAAYGQRTWAEAEYAYSRAGGGLLVEWGHRAGDTEQSLLLAGYVEVPAYLRPGAPAPVVFKLLLRGYIDIAGEMGLAYPLANGRGGETGTYWQVRMSRTFTLAAGKRRSTP